MCGSRHSRSHLHFCYRLGSHLYINTCANREKSATSEKCSSITLCPKSLRSSLIIPSDSRLADRKKLSLCSSAIFAGSQRFRKASHHLNLPPSSRNTCRRRP